MAIAWTIHFRRHPEVLARPLRRASHRKSALADLRSVDLISGKPEISGRRPRYTPHRTKERCAAGILRGEHAAKRLHARTSGRRRL